MAVIFVICMAKDNIQCQDRLFYKAVIEDIIQIPDGLLMRYFHDWKMYCCYYDKKKHKMYKLNSGGYLNDYDSGMDFTLARMSVSPKNRFVQTAFYADDFISFLEQKKQDGKTPKGPESAIQALQKLAQKVDAEDNPIIMILKLKEEPGW